MEVLVPIFAILAVFGFPVAGILAGRMMRYRHEQRLKEIEMQGAQAALPAASPEAAKELESRVQHLETIVCSVDFELNAKLDRLARQQLAAGPPSRPALGGMELSETIQVLDGALRPGAKIADRFVVESALGRGAMGAVYVARDERLGETIALKVVAGLAAIHPDAHARLRREGAIARRISHPNVVRLYDVGEHEGLVFLSMEYVDGEDLEARLRRGGPMPPAEVRELVRQVCEGLAAAHAAGAVHRDLKPGNIILDAAGRPRIIDFGLARLAQLEGMSATNLIAGTPAYMAPEQVRGGTVDARTDIYAAGAITYQLLTGQPPFEADNPIALAMLHCNREPAPPSSLRPELGAAWDAPVLRALAKRPEARFPSAAAFAEALPAADALGA